jgi:hypothetical protein
MNIRPFINDVSFDDQAIRAMREAFDQACDVLGAFGGGATVREIMAKRIVDVAQTGERDPSRLYRQALKALGIDEMSARQLAA